MSESAVHAGFAIAATYCLIGLLPVRWRVWQPIGTALAPAAVGWWMLGLAPWPAGLAVVLIWIGAALGLTARQKLTSGVLWIAAQVGTLLLLIGMAVWAAPVGVRVPYLLGAGALLVAGGIVVIEWGGEFVGRATRPFAEQLHEETGDQDGLVAVRGLPKGFQDGGKTIGRWERLLIYVFVLASAPAAIGFLVTAKSILRFGEIKDRDTQKEAEYIIIGTLMSFGFALVAAYLTRFALLQFLPPEVWEVLLHMNGW